WIALIRSHAKVVAYDDVVFPVFKRLCKRLQKQHNCIPDEHYVQTLLAMHDLEGELERRTVTYTSWIQSATNMETKSWHPVTYNYASSKPEQIKRIKDIDNVYYETEHRREWCRIFKRLCKRRPALDANKGYQNLAASLLLKSWIQSATNMETKSWHPVTYNYASSNPEQIKKIKDIMCIETEHQREWCRSNAMLVPCFIFARKFSRDGAMRLMSQEVSGNFDLLQTSP
nr:glycosyl transferase, family 14 [Tanacetum cinerariifolium]